MADKDLTPRERAIEVFALLRVWDTEENCGVLLYLLLADHAHLVPILDVATDAGVVLVRPLLPRDLAGWVLERGAPQPGEAVTALAPIAAALGALHAVGATAGGVTAQQVRLDADGAPLRTWRIGGEAESEVGE